VGNFAENGQASRDAQGTSSRVGAPVADMRLRRRIGLVASAIGAITLSRNTRTAPVCVESSPTARCVDVLTSMVAGASAVLTPGGSGRLSRKSALGTKKRPPVTAVEKSSIRS